MRGPQPVALVVVVVGMLLSSTASTALPGTNTKKMSGKASVSWPETGFKICQQLVEVSLQTSCYDCFTNADTFGKVKRCVRDWLPPIIARCATAATTETKFKKCVSENYVKNMLENKKANTFYEKSSKYISGIANYKHLKDGPAALFSTFAQGLLFSTGGVQNALSTSDECRRRFNPGQRRGAQPRHLTQDPQPRNIQYDYGTVGHDMPFKGVGPLASAVLSGICHTHYLENQQKLQLLANTAMNSELPVPAWIFQEVVKNINSNSIII